MKVLVTGVEGQLGYDVINELHKRGYQVIGSGISAEYSGITDLAAVTFMSYIQMDITNADLVEKKILEMMPDVIVHCAAWTAVDMAEDEDKIEKVYAVNVTGTENIVKVCKKIDCKLIYLSTDYVFDGQGIKPWEPDCKEYRPLNVYGKTKLEGELAVSRNLDKYFIVRIAWVFGKNGKNFVKTMLKLSETHEKVRVVKDQVGSPTSADELAKAIAYLLPTENYGLFHGTCEGDCSWSEFAEEIFRLAGKKTVVEAITTEEYGAAAARPAYSILDNYMFRLTSDFVFSDWHDAVARYMKGTG